MHYFEYSKSKTEEDFMRCLLHAFEYFGGKTKKVLTDDMSAIIYIDNSGNRNIHPTVIQFFKDIDVELKLCKVRTPLKQKENARLQINLHNGFIVITLKKLTNCTFSRKFIA